MFARLDIFHRRFVEDCLVFLMMRIDNPQIVVNMALLIYTSEQVEALSEDLALQPLLISERP